MKLRKFIFSIIILTTLLVIILLFINELKSGSDDTQPSNTSTENDANLNSVKLNKEFSDLVSVIQNSEGTFGLYIKDLSLNTEYKFNENEEFYPLSLYKIPISYIVVKDVEKGKLNWEDEIIYTRSDYYDQYGTIALSGFGSKYTIDKLIELMLRESDNTALKMIENLLGKEYLNSEFKKITENENADLFNEEEVTTPKAFAYIIENIFFKVSMQDQNREKLLSYMYPTAYDEALNPYLRENLVFYHKVGISEGMYHNCGIVRNEEKNIILCLMSKDFTEESFNRVNQYVAEFINNF